MKNFEFGEIERLVTKSKSILVTSHHNPDGDAIGSILALTILLRKTGHNANAMVPNDYPGFLKWMPGSENIIVFDRDVSHAKELISNADLIFCLDYSALNRTSDMESALRESEVPRILIDHHLEPQLTDFTYYLTEVKVSSTSELLYRFIEECGWGSLIDQDIATGLFVGIMTDTGSFSFSCNYSETFQTTSLLIQTGIDAEKIHRLVYDTYSESRLRLLGYCLSEKLTVLPELHTAYIALSNAEMERFNYQVGDTEGVVNYALSIDQVKLAVLLTERSDSIRLSFRSKGDLSVNQIAREHFNGGGHRNAAGGDSYISLEETIKQLKKVLLQYKQSIERSSF